MSSPSRLHVFYGSQTGNAEFIAKRIHKECGERGLESQLVVLNDWKKLTAPTFEEVQVAVFVISTTGNGDSPENSEKFWRFIKRRTNAKDMLSKMQYTVLGLGDTNYDKFCHMGKSLDSRLSELSATRFHKLGCADEAVGLENSVEPWIASMWPSLTTVMGGTATDATQGGASATPVDASAEKAEGPKAAVPAPSSDTSVPAPQPEATPSPSKVPEKVPEKEETQPADVGAPSGATRPLHVFYGSQTGNAEFIAKRIHKECGERGLESQLVVMNDWKKLANPTFEEVEVALFIISTTGNGDAPENAEKFWRFVKRRTHPKDMLAKMQYSVLGLGDTNYDKFCHMGKSLDSRLADLSAVRFHQLGCADEAVGLENSVEPWIASMWPSLLQAVGSGSAGATAPVATAGGASPLPTPKPTPLSPPKAPASPAPEPTTTAAIPGPVDRTGGPACAASGVRWLSDVTPRYEDWRAQALLNTQPPPAFDMELEVEIVNDGELGPSCSVAGGGSDLQAPVTGINWAGGPGAVSAVTANVHVDGAGRADEGSVRATVAAARYLADMPDRRVIELKLSFPPEGGLSYTPGDAIGVHCPNPPLLVQSLLTRLASGGADSTQIRPTSRVTVRRGSALGGQLPPGISVHELLTWHADLTQPPKQRLLRALACYCSGEEDRQLLLHLAHPSSAKAYEGFVAAQRLSLPELLELFPSCCPPLPVLLDLLPPLAPRYYSVASSPLVDPDIVTVAFTVVDYTLQVPSALVGQPPFPIRRRGLGTSWLEGLAKRHIASHRAQPPSPSSMTHSEPLDVSVLLKPAKEFILPGNAKWPLIFIGPGTGVSPFMGFMQHRLAKRNRQRRVQTEVCTGYWRGGFEVSEEGEEEEGSVEAYSSKEGQGPIWLFFGCRSRDGDWLFRQEMEQYLKEGVLTELSTAFSRDAPDKKVYVQDRMLEHGARLCKWLLSENAYVYVCGDADNMARDVHAALKSILLTHGGPIRFPDPAAADTFLSQLKQRQRYVLDIWT